MFTNRIKHISLQLFSLCLLLMVPASLISGLALVPMLSIVAVTAFFFVIIKPKWAHIQLPLPFILLWGLLLATIPSLLLAPEPASAWSLWGRIFALSLAGWCTYLVLSQTTQELQQKANRYLIRGIYISLIVIIIETYTQGAITGYIRSLLSNHPKAFTLEFLNRGACVLALMIWPCMAILFTERKHRTAWLFWIATLFLLIQLESLSAIAAHIISGIVYAFIHVTKRKGAYILLTLIPVCLVTIPAITYHIDFSTFAKEFSWAPKSATHRIHIWDYTSRQAQEKPIWGWGFDASRHIDNNASPHSLESIPLHPHNSILQLWLETGLAGIIGFIALATSCIWQSIKSSASNALLAANICATISYLTIGLFAYGIWQNWWISAGLLCSLALVNCQQFRQTA